MQTMEKQRTETFEVGDGATYNGWSDAQAGTIIERTAKTSRRTAIT